MSNQCNPKYAQMQLMQMQSKIHVVSIEIKRKPQSQSSYIPQLSNLTINETLNKI